MDTSYVSCSDWNNSKSLTKYHCAAILFQSLTKEELLLNVARVLLENDIPLGAVSPRAKCSTRVKHVDKILQRFSLVKSMKNRDNVLSFIKLHSTQILHLMSRLPSVKDPSKIQGSELTGDGNSINYSYDAAALSVNSDRVNQEIYSNSHLRSTKIINESKKAIKLDGNIKVNTNELVQGHDKDSIHLDKLNRFLGFNTDDSHKTSSGYYGAETNVRPGSQPVLNYGSSNLCKEDVVDKKSYALSKNRKSPLSKKQIGGSCASMKYKSLSAQEKISIIVIYLLENNLSHEKISPNLPVRKKTNHLNKIMQLFGLTITEKNKFKINSLINRHIGSIKHLFDSHHRKLTGTPYVDLSVKVNIGEISSSCNGAVINEELSSYGQSEAKKSEYDRENAKSNNRNLPLENSISANKTTNLKTHSTHLREESFLGKKYGQSEAKKSEYDRENAKSNNRNLPLENSISANKTTNLKTHSTHLREESFLGKKIHKVLSNNRKRPSDCCDGVAYKSFTGLPVEEKVRVIASYLMRNNHSVESFIPNGVGFKTIPEDLNKILKDLSIWPSDKTRRSMYDTIRRYASRIQKYILSIKKSTDSSFANTTENNSNLQPSLHTETGALLFQKSVSSNGVPNNKPENIEQVNTLMEIGNNNKVELVDKELKPVLEDETSYEIQHSKIENIELEINVMKTGCENKEVMKNKESSSCYNKSTMELSHFQLMPVSMNWTDDSCAKTKYRFMSAQEKVSIVVNYLLVNNLSHENILPNLPVKKKTNHLNKIMQLFGLTITEKNKFKINSLINRHIGSIKHLFDSHHRKLTGTPYVDLSVKVNIGEISSSCNGAVINEELSSYGQSEAKKSEYDRENAKRNNRNLPLENSISANKTTNLKTHSTHLRKESFLGKKIQKVLSNNRKRPSDCCDGVAYKSFTGLPVEEKVRVIASYLMRNNHSVESFIPNGVGFKTIPEDLNKILKDLSIWPSDKTRRSMYDTIRRYASRIQKYILSIKKSTDSSFANTTENNSNLQPSLPTETGALLFQKSASNNGVLNNKLENIEQVNTTMEVGNNNKVELADKELKPVLEDETSYEIQYSKIENIEQEINVMKTGCENKVFDKEVMKNKESSTCYNESTMELSHFQLMPVSMKRTDDSCAKTKYRFMSAKEKVSIIVNYLLVNNLSHEDISPAVPVKKEKHHLTKLLLLFGLNMTEKNRTIMILLIKRHRANIKHLLHAHHKKLTGTPYVYLSENATAKMSSSCDAAMINNELSSHSQPKAKCYEYGEKHAESQNSNASLKNGISVFINGSTDLSMEGYLNKNISYDFSKNKKNPSSYSYVGTYKSFGKLPVKEEVRGIASSLRKNNLSLKSIIQKGVGFKSISGHLNKILIDLSIRPTYNTRRSMYDKIRRYSSKIRMHLLNIDKSTGFSFVNTIENNSNQLPSLCTETGTLKFQRGLSNNDMPNYKLVNIKQENKVMDIEIGNGNKVLHDIEQLQTVQINQKSTKKKTSSNETKNSRNKNAEQEIIVTQTCKDKVNLINKNVIDGEVLSESNRYTSFDYNAYKSFRKLLLKKKLRDIALSLKKHNLFVESIIQKGIGYKGIPEHLNKILIDLSIWPTDYTRRSIYDKIRRYARTIRMHISSIDKSASFSFVSTMANNSNKQSSQCSETGVLLSQKTISNNNVLNDKLENIEQENTLTEIGSNEVEQLKTIQRDENKSKLKTLRIKLKTPQMKHLEIENNVMKICCENKVELFDQIVMDAEESSKSLCYHETTTTDISNIALLSVSKKKMAGRGAKMKYKSMSAQEKVSNIVHYLIENNLSLEETKNKIHHSNILLQIFGLNVTKKNRMSIVAVIKRHIAKIKHLLHAHHKKLTGTPYVSLSEKVNTTQLLINTNHSSLNNSIRKDKSQQQKNATVEISCSNAAITSDALISHCHCEAKHNGCEGENAESDNSYLCQVYSIGVNRPTDLNTESTDLFLKVSHEKKKGNVLSDYKKMPTYYSYGNACKVLKVLPVQEKVRGIALYLMRNNLSIDTIIPTGSSLKNEHYDKILKDFSISPTDRSRNSIYHIIKHNADKIQTQILSLNSSTGSLKVNTIDNESEQHTEFCAVTGSLLSQNTKSNNEMLNDKLENIEQVTTEMEIGNDKVEHNKKKRKTIQNDELNSKLITSSIEICNALSSHSPSEAKNNGYNGESAENDNSDLCQENSVCVNTPTDLTNESDLFIKDSLEKKKGNVLSDKKKSPTYYSYGTTCKVLKVLLVPEKVRGIALYLMRTNLSIDAILPKKISIKIEHYNKILIDFSISPMDRSRNSIYHIVKRNADKIQMQILSLNNSTGSLNINTIDNESEQHTDLCAVTGSLLSQNTKSNNEMLNDKLENIEQVTTEMEIGSGGFSVDLFDNVNTMHPVINTNAPNEFNSDSFMAMQMVSSSCNTQIVTSFAAGNPSSLLYESLSMKEKMSEKDICPSNQFNKKIDHGFGEKNSLNKDINSFEDGYDNSILHGIEYHNVNKQPNLAKLEELCKNGVDDSFNPKKKESFQSRSSLLEFFSFDCVWTKSK